MLDGEYLDGTVTCHATEGADCRLSCTADCEEWELVDHEHELADAGRCLVIEWIENTGVTECHTGRHAPVDGFIEAEFDGDGYTWTYVPDG